MDLLYLTEIGIQAAHAAGKIILQNKDKAVLVEKKRGQSSHASQVVTMVDRACERAIQALLLPSCIKFDIAFLSEETKDDGSRFTKEFFWCVDPMDGTLCFINRQPGFSVTIALVTRDGTPLIGIVYDPSTDTLYHAIKGQGCFRNNQPWKVQAEKEHLSYLTDRKLEDTPHAKEIKKWLEETASVLGLGEVKEIHGAGAVLNGIKVLENSPACMLKLPKKENGGGSIWDFAAITCIFQEMGALATDYRGGKLDLNSADGTFMNRHGIFFRSFRKIDSRPNITIAKQED